MTLVLSGVDDQLRIMDALKNQLTIVLSNAEHSQDGAPKHETQSITYVSKEKQER